MARQPSEQGEQVTSASSRSGGYRGGVTDALASIQCDLDVDRVSRAAQREQARGGAPSPTEQRTEECRGESGDSADTSQRPGFKNEMGGNATHGRVAVARRAGTTSEPLIDHRRDASEASPDAGRRAGPAEVVPGPVFARTWELIQAWTWETEESGIEVTPEMWADEWPKWLAMARAEHPEGFVPLVAVKLCSCGRPVEAGRETCATWICTQYPLWMEQRRRMLEVTATVELVREAA